MKITMKKSFAVIMVFVMCVSVLFGMNLSVFAADTNTVTYVKDGSYVYNWGQRGTTATFLSPMAQEYYSDNNISLDALLALDGSSTESTVPSSALYIALQNLMEKNHTHINSYDEIKTIAKYTDCQNGGGKISSFYSGTEIGPEWDNTEWNREHTWPNSKGDLAGNGEDDIMMIRPTASSENGSRNNKAYGTTTNSNYFNPNNFVGSTGYDLRGDVARIILYQYVRWEVTNTGSGYNTTGIFGTAGVIESQDVLIDWMEADPVDTWEMGRNDAVEAITGTRNVFVDYPELAFDLFNESVPTNYTSPSDGTSIEGTTGTGGAGSTGSDTTLTPGTQITFEFGENGEATHSDGGEATSYSETASGYTLTLESLSKVYKNARDAKGNSALKLGTTKAAGSFSFTVPDDVGSVVIEVAKYKSNAAKIKVNDTDYTISSASDNGVYDEITVDTTTNKTVNFTTVSGGYRCMINSITYVIAGSEGGETPDPEEPTPDPDPEEPTPDTPVIPEGATTKDITITFDNTSKRSDESDASKQIWSENGITVTNNKHNSGNDVNLSYYNPIRCYASSNLVIEYPNITKITFLTNGSSYTTALKNSLGTAYTVTDANNYVTVELTSAVDSFSIEEFTAQVQLKSITITTIVNDTYKITAQSNNTEYGTVELNADQITATPAEGYEVAGYEIISGSATVKQTGNVFVVTASSDVTVQINFAARKQFTVKFSEQGTIANTLTAYSGDQITLPEITEGDYTVAGWVSTVIDGETEDKPATIYAVGSNYTVTANTTLYALYSRTAAGSGGESNVFAKYSGTITEGEYVITYNNYALKAAISSNRFANGTVTKGASEITSPDASIIWKVTADGSYYTLYNESTGKYAAGNGTKNQGKLLDSVTDYARWTVSGTSTYEFVNKGNKAKGVNSNLRNNGTYGFACYSTSTGGALTLYKRTAAALTTYYFTGAAPAEYEVTAEVNNSEYGEVTVSGTTIIATPAEGYAIAGYEVTSGTATVVQEGSTFFVTLSSDATVQINFVALPVYTVTFVENGETVGSEEKYSNGQITLPAHKGELDEFTTFDGWATTENETDKSKIYAAGSKYAVTGNVTLYAQYTITVIESASHDFVKVTENLDDYTGTYLIVYEAGNKALNGAITEKVDGVGNNVDVQIVGGKIVTLSANMAAIVKIEKIDGGYTMRTNSGLFFGSESDTNSLLSNASKTYVNTISIDADGNAVITGEGGAILRYNATSGQDRFRFYASDKYQNQKAIALYKLETVGEFASAQVSVGADLGIKYGVDVTNIDEITEGTLQMRFTVDDVSTTVVGTRQGNQYAFDFAGLAPQRMGDNIKAELLFHGVVVETKDNYSIRQNVLNLLANNPENEELKQFISDMLYYGAAAQKYSGYKKNNLVTDGIEDLLNAPLDKELTEEYNKLFLSEPTTDIRFKSATVWFDVVNKLIVKVNNPNNDAIKVYVTREGGERIELYYDPSVGGYMTDEIKVTDFQTTYTFEIVDESNNVLQTLTYSVNTYAFSKQNSTNPAMVELALALFRLGQSAEKL